MTEQISKTWIIAAFSLIAALLGGYQMIPQVEQELVGDPTFTYALCAGTTNQLGDITKVKMGGVPKAGEKIDVVMDMLVTVKDEVVIDAIAVEAYYGTTVFYNQTIGYGIPFDKGYSNIKTSWHLPANTTAGQMSGKLHFLDSQQQEWICVDYTLQTE